MKKLLKNIFKKFGFEISRIPDEKEMKNLSFDEIFKKIIKNNKPIIFDIGANKGQSIERFLKVNNNAVIHSFEPNKDEFDLLKKKYNNNKNIKLNNIALGEKKSRKYFNITEHSANSSFLELNKDTNWIKLRSSQLNVDKENYIKKKIEVDIETLDTYCNQNLIEKIDIVKIDTQGYEEQILIGCKEMIESQKIDALEIEITFSSVYEKYVCFSDIEKYLVPNNYRLSGIRLHNNNLFSGAIFFADVLFLNKSKFNL